MKFSFFTRMDVVRITLMLAIMVALVRCGERTSKNGVGDRDRADMLSLQSRPPMDYFRFHEEEFQKVLVGIFDTLQLNSDFRDKFLIDVTSISPDARQAPIANFLKHPEVISAASRNQKIELASKLQSSEFDIRAFDGELKVNKTRLLFYDANSFLRKPDCAGSFHMTPFAFNPQGDSAAFYFVLNCGHECERKFIFFINKVEERWGIDEYYHL